MPVVTPTAEAPVATTETFKVKKVPAKKTEKKVAKVKEAPKDRAKTFHGVTCSNGKFWNSGRQMIVEALRKMNADSATTARSATEITAKIKNDDFDGGKVSRYLATQEPLIAGAIVKKVVTEEGTKFHLTALGGKCKFEY